MSLKLEKKGYVEENLDCPNCGSSITLYRDEKGVIRKAYWAEVSEDGKIKCEHCESILSYQPK